MFKMTRREFVNVLIPSAVAGALLDPFDLAAVSGLRMERGGADLRFVSGSKTVARIPAVAQGDGKGGVDKAKFGAIGAEKTLWTFQSGPWEVSGQIRLLEQGFYEWRRSWKNRTSQTVQADLCMEIESGYSPEFTLIPGISYNGNPEYGRMAVKGLASDRTPWVFSAFRSNIPAGNYSEGTVGPFLSSRLRSAALCSAVSLSKSEINGWPTGCFGRSGTICLATVPISRPSAKTLP